MNNIPRNKQFYNLCENNGDEYRYIMICPDLKEN